MNDNQTERSKAMLPPRKIIWLATVGGACLIAVLVAVLANDHGKSESAIKLEDPDGKAGPSIVATAVNADKVGLYEKFELTPELKARYDNPYDPEQLDLRAVFLSPKGKEWHINGFYDGESWRIRFAPSELGEWRYRLQATDKTGTTTGEEGVFEAAASDRHGWVQVSDRNKRFLKQADGTPFYGVGAAYPWGVTESGLDKLKSAGGNLITYWNGNYDSAGGSKQLESTASGIGRYDTDKGQRVDELVGMLESRNMKMNFVIWPHDSLTDKLEGWPATWTKNAYSTLGEAKDFYKDEKMWKYQEKLYRYIIARWGYSEAIGSWNLITEMSGTDGWAFGDKQVANAWLTKVHDYFRANDPYGHPTAGSKAGNENDYWAHAYRTLDIADRENYYDLTVSGYAEDIARRWQPFEKPLFIGETGNITDATTYHQALWTGLSNGLAATPIWWDITKLDEDMYMMMSSLAQFVGKLDLSEIRAPAKLKSGTVSISLKDRPVEDGKDIADWSQPNWADANKDEKGNDYSAQLEDGSIRTSMLFRSGAFSQGALTQFFQKQDWSGYPRLLAEVYIEQAGSEEIKLRPVLFPNGNWDEGNDASDVKLVSGQWTTMDVPLLDAPEGYWRNNEIKRSDLQNMMGFGLKLWTGASAKDAKPVTVKVRNVRLAADPGSTVAVEEIQGWIMKGDKTSYGWLLANEDEISGKKATVDNFGEGKATISWYDPWSGTPLEETTADSDKGALALTAPTLARPDIAFIIRRST
ncbi:DUF5060 domain-containing protein [Cohnella suwonensis]|uniref:DUF5060 domain-containing protein n=1 Tax=Cohnella suwonensis TaxID=696072 RepID=A0ABW0LSM9_9BACL